MDNLYNEISKKSNKLSNKMKNKKTKKQLRDEIEIKNNIRKEIYYKDITASCNELLNFFYDNNYFKKFYLLKLFVVCFFCLLFANNNIYFFISIIRDPITAYKHSCYDIHTNSYFKCTLKNMCICEDISKCVNTYFGDEEICTKNFKSVIFNAKDRGLIGQQFYLCFNNEERNNTIFNNVKEYCRIPNAIIRILTISFIGGVIGELFLGVLSDMYGKRIIIMILLIILIINSFAIAIKHTNKDENLDLIININSIVYMYSIYGFILFFCSYPLSGLIYTYIFENFPSKFNYFDLNFYISSNQLISYFMIYGFSNISHFKYFYWMCFATFLVLLVLFYYNCFESIRYYAEYADFYKKKSAIDNIVSYERLFFKKEIYKSSNEKSFDSVLVEVDEKKVEFNKEMNKSKYYYNILLIYGEEIGIKINSDISNNFNLLYTFSNNKRNNKTNETEIYSNNKLLTNNDEINKRIKTRKTSKNKNLINYNVGIDCNKLSIKSLSNIKRNKHLRNNISDNKNGFIIKKSIKNLNNNDDYNNVINKNFLKENKLNLNNNYHDFNKINNIEKTRNITKNKYEANSNTGYLITDNILNNKLFYKEKIIPKIKKKSFFRIVANMKLTASLKETLLLYTIIWLLYSYISFGLSVRFIIDIINKSDQIISKKPGIIPYTILMIEGIYLIQSKVALYISVKNIIFICNLIIVCLCIIPDYDNIWLDSDRSRYFGTNPDDSKLDTHSYAKLSSMIFSSLVFKILNLMTISVPYTAYRNTFFGICRCLSTFSMLISVLYLTVNKTQIITIAILGGLCIKIFFTINIFLKTNISLSELYDSETLKYKLILSLYKKELSLNSNKAIYINNY